MKTKLFFMLLLLLQTGFSYAKTVYVTDNMSFTLKVDDSINSPILTTVTSGTPLILISKKRGSDYTKVRLENGQEGFILSSYLANDPSHKFYLAKANQELEKIKQDNAKLQSQLNALKNDNPSYKAATSALTKERDQLNNELITLRETAAGAIELKQQHDLLEQNFVKATKELEQLKLEKQTLETNANQDWFIYGGLLSLFGVLLGYILPKLSWRRRSHNWDSF